MAPAVPGGPLSPVLPPIPKLYIYHYCIVFKKYIYLTYLELLVFRLVLLHPCVQEVQACPVVQEDQVDHQDHPCQFYQVLLFLLGDLEPQLLLVVH